MVADDSNPETMNLQDPEEADEALSLCDLPLYNDGVDWEDFKNYDRKASSDQEFFEFFNDLSAEIGPPKDIIFCGKLIPFKERPIPNEAHTNSIKEDQSRNSTKKSFFRRRSESLNDSQSSRSSCTKGRFMWNSRSLDYRKLRRVSSSKKSLEKTPANDCIPSGKCFGKCDFSISSFPAKPRWYVFAFGFAKFPPEMELKDIKNRQSRRNPSSLFPVFNGGETVSVNRSRGKGSWGGLLRALSCKGHANAAVSSSFGCRPHM